MIEGNIRIIFAFISLILNFIILYNLVEQNSYSKLLRNILILEGIYYFSYTLLPNNIFDISENQEGVLQNLLIDPHKAFDYILPFLREETIKSIKRRLKIFNLVTSDCFQNVSIIQNSFLSLEIIFSFKDPISSMTKRMIIYSIISLIVIISMFVMECYFLEKNPDKYILYHSQVYIIYSVIIGFYVIIFFYNIIFVIKRLCESKAKFVNYRLQKIYLFRNVIFQILFISCFFPALIYRIYYRLNNKEYHTSAGLEYLHLGTGLFVFFPRVMETKFLWLILNDNDQEDRGHEQLSSVFSRLLNTELVSSILFGLYQIYKVGAFLEEKGVRTDMTMHSGEYLKKRSQELFDNYGLQKKDFYRSKTYKFAYNRDGRISNSFDESFGGMEITSEATVHMKKNQNIEREFESMGDLRFRNDKQSQCILSTKASKKKRRYDAEIEEYYPKIFSTIREKDDITPDLLEESLNPQKNPDYFKSLVESKGKSGSFFFQTGDKRFIIKTIKTSELQTLIGDFFLSYVTHILANENTYIAKIYGVYTLSINSGSISVHLILMQNLIPCSIEHLKYTFDLKGSTFQRDTDVLRSGQNPLKALKDLDFLWLKAVDKQLVDFSKDYKHEIMEQLEEDAKFLCDNNLMDYSLFFVVVKLYDIQDQFEFNNIMGLLGDKLYYKRTFKSCKDQVKYLYIIGIIDYLQDYNMQKRLEHCSKSIIRIRETKNMSAQEPGYYASRFLKFMQENLFGK